MAPASHSRRRATAIPRFTWPTGTVERPAADEPSSDDITPTWSPSGTQIAFTSDRRGKPQI